MLIRACALATADAPATDVIELRFDQRERSRLRAPLATGEEIGIDLPVGTILSHGSRLALADGRIVAVGFQAYYPTPKGVQFALARYLSR